MRGNLFNIKPNHFSLIAKFLVVIITATMLLLSCQPISIKQDQIKEAQVPPAQQTGAEVNAAVNPSLKFENDSITSTTHIHYTGKYCNECHSQTPVKGGDRYLKFNGDYKQLCRCHIDLIARPLHPYGIKPSPEKLKRIPPDFPLEDGKLMCDTCHDIYLQCQKSPFKKTSLRGAPYSKRTDFCFKCHEKQKYQKFDPHKQIDDSGEVIIETCLFCHKEKPDAAHATFKDVKFIGGIEALCRRCHLIAGNHSGNFNHLGVVPSPEMLKYMNAMEEKYNFILPLDENGKMTCVTCHNPHEKGVIPDDRPAATGASSEYRHRLPGKLCLACHKM